MSVALVLLKEAIATFVNRTSGNLPWHACNSHMSDCPGSIHIAMYVVRYMNKPYSQKSSL